MCAADVTVLDAGGGFKETGTLAWVTVPAESPLSSDVCVREVVLVCGAVSVFEPVNVCEVARVCGCAVGALALPAVLLLLRE